MENDHKVFPIITEETIIEWQAEYEMIRLDDGKRLINVDDTDCICLLI